MDHKSLKRWFLLEQRDLPWRVNRTPYAVWISEMMLQQTQVSVVIPYFERWMQQFPTVAHLAAATLDEVIKVWEGLGYYSRARYLHQGAKWIVENCQGEFPQNPEQLEKIKGLGPYTVGAIRSFAFHHRVAAVDGNVMRVLTRYCLIKEDICKPKVVKYIRDLANEMLPEEESWIVNEALIELGATICMKKPRCQECPIRNSCRGYAEGVAHQLPIKTAKVPTTFLYRAVAVVRCGDHWLITRGEKGKIMSDLHEFPYYEVSDEGISDKTLKKMVGEQFNLQVAVEASLPEVSHSFTRYRVKLMPILFSCDSPTLPSVGDSYMWVTEQEWSQLAFSSGHRRIKNTIKGP